MAATRQPLRQPLGVNREAAGMRMIVGYHHQYLHRRLSQRLTFWVGSCRNHSGQMGRPSAGLRNGPASPEGTLSVTARCHAAYVALRSRPCPREWTARWTPPPPGTGFSTRSYVHAGPGPVLCCFSRPNRARPRPTCGLSTRDWHEWSRLRGRAGRAGARSPSPPRPLPPSHCGPDAPPMESWPAFL